jgi:hypothetical protein
MHGTREALETLILAGIKTYMPVRQRISSKKTTSKIFFIMYNLTKAEIRYFQ